MQLSQCVTIGSEYAPPIRKKTNNWSYNILCPIFYDQLKPASIANRLTAKNTVFDINNGGLTVEIPTSLPSYPLYLLKILILYNNF